MRRVLKPGGSLCFVEHGLSPEPGVERWQYRLTPPWRCIAGGCHLDRKMDDLIRQAGFDLTDLHEEYAPGPRPMSYMDQGAPAPVHLMDNRRPALLIRTGRLVPIRRGGYSRDQSFAVIRGNMTFMLLMAAGSILGTFIGGLLLGIVPTSVLLPLLAALLILSAYKVWTHE